ncbi:MAG: hypothetical protein WB646_03205, partial [Steroidobacteraceae bacterium]
MRAPARRNTGARHRRLAGSGSARIEPACVCSGSSARGGLAGAVVLFGDGSPAAVTATAIGHSGAAARTASSHACTQGGAQARADRDQTDGTRPNTGPGPVHGKGLTAGSSRTGCRRVIA